MIKLTSESLAKYPLLQELIRTEQPDEIFLKADLNQQFAVRIEEGFISNFNLLEICCLYGKTNHIQALWPSNPDELAPQWYLTAIRYAAQNGHTATLQHLESHLSLEERIMAVKANNYATIRCAAENSHTATIQHLESHLSLKEPIEAVKANDYAAIHYAAQNGQTATIQYLESHLSPEERKEAVKADNYAAIRCAAQNDHTATIQHLESHLSLEERIMAVKANNYAAIRCAVENSHTATLHHLESHLSLKERKEAVKANDYAAIHYAAQNGYTATIQYLESHLSPEERKEAVKADNYAAIRYAAQNGHTATIQHLESHLSLEERKEAVKANDYGAILYAALNGYTATIQHLESHLSPAERNEAVKESNYEAIRNTAHNGHTATLLYLESHLSSAERKEAVRTFHYEAIRYVAQSGHIAILHHFLKMDVALAYLESHDQEYGVEYTYPYVTERLNALSTAKASYEQANPQGVFNLNEDEAHQGFYLLRNLIRRGVASDNRPAEDQLDNIRFLLSIPAIRALCAQCLNPDEGGQENELLRFALRIGNNSAAGLLMQVPEVRRLAVQNNHYRNELLGDLDLEAIANNPESSMVALNAAEREALAAAEHHYQPQINARGGHAAVFAELVTTIKARYAAHPATLKRINLDGTVRELELPLSWPRFLGLIKKEQLSPAEKKQAFEAYYQHPAHTALRYLSKPNYWMAANAGYVNRYVNEAGFATDFHYSTFEDYQKLISLLYLAAFDKDTPAIDGYTLEGRQDLFIRELALIGRAHNWDNTRFNAVTQKNEEYDDLQGDKPSCYSGVNRRLFQSVLGHPLFKQLTPELTKQCLNEHLRAYFKSRITQDNVRALHAANQAIINYEDDTEKALETLATLNLSPEDQEKIISQASEQLAKQFPQPFQARQNLWIACMEEYLKQPRATKVDFIAFDGSAQLSPLLDELLKQAPSTASQLGTFTKPTRDTQPATPPNPFRIS